MEPARRVTSKHRPHDFGPYARSLLLLHPAGGVRRELQNSEQNVVLLSCVKSYSERMSIHSVAEFLRVNEEDGFVVTPVQFDAGMQFDDHAHDFASRIIITEGTLSITTDGVQSMLAVGDVYELSANKIHSEIVGSEGVVYLSARPRI
jgi:quercetin dioxygenase-like cupin family protein